MREYISLLRGINVGGKTLKMESLVEIYESMELRDVKTYIQSGNVLFNAKNPTLTGITEELGRRIRERSGLEVTIIVKNQKDLAKIIERNPFTRSGSREVNRLHITFLDKRPGEELQEGLSSGRDGNDEYRMIGTEIYLYCPEGYGKTLFSNSYFEKHLHVRATTRNWNTVNKLYMLSQESV
jgi:uncharacterized protein (DUF1697 family)